VTRPTVALIYDRSVRTDTTGEHCRHALQEFAQVVFAIAAQHASGSPKTRRYGAAIIQRIDELAEVLGAYRSLYEIGEDLPLPHGMLKAFRDRLHEADPYELLKYRGDRQRPSLRDVLLAAQHSGGRRPRRSVPKPVFEYLVNGRLVDGAPTMFEARERLLACETLDEALADPRLMGEAGATWEFAVSRFGNEARVWEALLSADLVPYMALVRNLRNLLLAGISGEALARVCQQLRETADHRLLPFRFLTAMEELRYMAESPKVCSADLETVLDALSDALDLAVQCVEPIPGRTLVLLDTSGSMRFWLSRWAGVIAADVAAVLAAVLVAKCLDGADLIIFADTYAKVDLPPGASLSGVVRRIEEVTGSVGEATTGHIPAMAEVTRSGESYDRIAVLSDMCAYGDPTTWKGKRKAWTFGQLIDRYRAKVNPNAFIWAINMVGYGATQVSPRDPRTVEVSGWSEAVIRYLREFEQGPPALERLYDRYGITG